MSATTGLIRKFIVARPSRRQISTTSGRSSSTSPQRRAAATPRIAPRRDVRPFTDIPGPIALPMLRHSAHVLPRIGNFHHSIGVGVLDGLRARYGDLVRLAQGTRSRPVLYVFHPELMQEVYDSHATEPPRWERSPLAEQRVSTAHGCPMHGDESKAIWAAWRALLSDRVLLKNYDEAFDDIAADATKRLGELRKQGNQLNEVLESELCRWALEALGVVVLGTRLGCLQDSKSEPSLADRLVESCLEISRSEYLVRSEHTLRTKGDDFSQALVAFDKHYSLIEEFLTSALRDLHSGSHKPEQCLLEKLRRLNRRLLPVAADFTLAGVDPLVQSALSLLQQLSVQAARQQRAHDEATWRRVTSLDTHHHVPTDQLPYASACVRESLRMSPPTGGVVRRSTDQLTVSGYQVPKGVDIVLAHGVASRSEEEWGRASSFIPERWLNESWQPLRSSRAHPCASMPFGENCPAEHMATKMLTSLVTHLMDKYRLEWHGPPPTTSTAGVNRIEPPFYFVLQDAA